MTTKLTLSINKEVIKNAKQFSHKHGISISKMVEKYLKHSIKDQPEKNNVTRKDHLPPFLKKMHGAIKINDKKEYREVYHDYIREKYSR